MAMPRTEDEMLHRLISRDPRSPALLQLSSVEIVERTIAERQLFKLASFILCARAPDEKAAETLIAAYRARRIPAWLTALFLRSLRVRSTYTVAREILLSVPGLLAESYAGEAMAELAGTDAESDLRDILIDPNMPFRARVAPSTACRRSNTSPASTAGPTSWRCTPSGAIIRRCAGSPASISPSCAT
ncbi:hypothetical protein POL58_30600 [Nannocystis sp. ncelm1]|uniref:HEAT repeat-containing protein n=2 Tax=Nannocystis radixulma TaxID=2995305 RepID=A0ABT5BDB4_9BACT|nr:hypothetical protein [Nannocystis radixulma]